MILRSKEYALLLCKSADKPFKYFLKYRHDWLFIIEFKEYTGSVINYLILIYLYKEIVGMVQKN